jgi:hypothetical protein
MSNSHLERGEPQHFELQAAFEWSEILLGLTRVLRLTESPSRMRIGGTSDVFGTLHGLPIGNRRYSRFGNLRYAS